MDKRTYTTDKRMIANMIPQMMRLNKKQQLDLEQLIDEVLNNNKDEQEKNEDDNE